MKIRFIIYGCFFQNLGKNLVRTNMHTAVQAMKIDIRVTEFQPFATTLFVDSKSLESVQANRFR